MSQGRSAVFLESIGPMVRVDGQRIRIDDFPAARQLLSETPFEEIFYGEDADSQRVRDTVLTMCRCSGIAVLPIDDLYTAVTVGQIDRVTSVVVDCKGRPGDMAMGVFQAAAELELGALVFRLEGMDEDQVRGAVCSVMAAAFCEGWPMPVMFRGEHLPFLFPSSRLPDSGRIEEIVVDHRSWGVAENATPAEFRAACAAAFEEHLSETEACETFDLVRRSLIPVSG